MPVPKVSLYARAERARPSQESSLGPGMGVSKALDSGEIRLTSPGVSHWSRGQPSATSPAAGWQSPVWTGRGDHLGAELT